MNPLRAVGLIVAGAVYAATPGSTGSSSAGAAYSAYFDSLRTDTLRAKAESSPAEGSAGLDRGAVQGYLSSWGLPPRLVVFSLTDSGLVFHSADGVAARAVSLSLAYVDDQKGRAHYLFRLDTGVFETEAPGPLLELAAHPAWLRQESGPAARRQAVAVVLGTTPLQAAQNIGRSSYADSLYSLFGRPRARVGLIGKRGRAAGRLGEYIASRDSLAFDPGHMTGEAQLRHALAHELGHRWQNRARAQLAALWVGVPAIRDPKRYGYEDQSEHQAEAIAFAVTFLQTTAAETALPGNSLALLDHYELLVPGTRALVGYLLLQPIYRNHPLRGLLTPGLFSYALEK